MANVDYILKLSEQFRKIINPFDIREFDSLPSFDPTRNVGISKEREKLLEQILFIGKGGSRNTYALSTRKALKVAKDYRGLDGNRVEFESSLKYNSIWLPKVFRKAEDYSWIEVELVRPLNDKNEINDLIGIDGWWFNFILMTRNQEKSFIESIDFLIKRNEKSFIKNPSSVYKKHNDKIAEISLLLESYKSNKFLFDLDELITKANLYPYELSMIENLGKSTSGHLVLLDVGAIKE